MNKEATKRKTPRRNIFILNTSSELAIMKAMDEVEKMGADERLTDAVILLQKAKYLVSDFIDSQLNQSA